MITHRFRFVKSFFKVFSNFFRLNHSLLFRCYLGPAHSRPAYVTTPQKLCQALFSSFFKLFSHSISASLAQSLAPLGFPLARDFRLSQSACLYQQNASTLSTLFFKNFDFFIHNFFHNYICAFPPLFATIYAVFTQFAAKHPAHPRKPTCGTVSVVLP